MQLTESQSRELLQKHGVYVTEVCDKCGKIPGHIRFTRFGEQGEWCSRKCRDGTVAVQRYNSTRKGGRPGRHETNADRQRPYRKRQAAA